jgi:hypothetical protein
VNPYIHADTADELRHKLDADLRSITSAKQVTDAVWNERAQFRAFLKATANDDSLRYPLEISHTSKTNPDFALSCPGFAIGVEASRITNEALHRLNHLKQQGKTAKAVAISPLLVGAGPMNNDELVTKTTVVGVPTSHLWNTATSEQDFWLSRARDVITRKTEIRRRSDYHDCGRNWLLLWDRLSMTAEDSRARAHLLERALTSYWSEEKVFEKIILECEELKWFTILSRQGSQDLKA